MHFVLQMGVTALKLRIHMKESD